MWQLIVGERGLAILAGIENDGEGLRMDLIKILCRWVVLCSSEGNFCGGLGRRKHRAIPIGLTGRGGAVGKGTRI